MKLMNDSNKELVLFHDTIDLGLRLIRKKALKEEDFEGFKYQRDFSSEVEVWIKE